MKSGTFSTACWHLWTLSLCLIPSLVQGQKCFDTRNELDLAIDDLYVAMFVGGSANAGPPFPDTRGVAEINATYGWVDDWCFGPDVTSFDNLFSFYEGKQGTRYPFAPQWLQRVGAYGEDFSGWKTENITSMVQTFEGTLFPSLGIASWDTGSVVNFFRTFYGNPNFNEDLGDWDVSNAQIMQLMFTRCQSFNQDLDRWVTDSLENPTYMFAGALSFNGKVNGWNMAKVTSLRLMFTDASSFNQDLNGWDVSNVENMDSTFRGALKFNGDISTWNVEKVGTFLYCFQDAAAFNSDIGRWSPKSAGTMEFMFLRASKFNIDISGWDMSSVQIGDGMFESASSFNQDLSSWNLTSMSQSWKMFLNAASFNQSLCDLQFSFPKAVRYYLPDAFGGTACPYQQDPGWYKRGPYCHACFDPTAPIPTAAPTSAPTVDGQGGSTSSAWSRSLGMTALITTLHLLASSWILG